jgi:hypothetical protein
MECRDSAIPSILRPCDWKNTPFGQLQALPQGGQAVTSCSNQDEAFINLGNLSKNQEN